MRRRDASFRVEYREPALLGHLAARCYIVRMSPNAKKLLERVSSWPEEDIAELEEIAREIEARRSGVYDLTAEEWADLQEGIAQADRREFVPDDVVAKANKRHGI